MESAVAGGLAQMNGIMLVLLGAASAAMLAGVGSAIGCGIAGQSGAGVISEDPDRFGNMLILQALPGTQGIYGFVILFMALGKLTQGTPDFAQGLQVFFACLPIALAGLLSAIYQGKVCAAGANLVAKRPDQLGRAMVLAAVVEFYAILGLLSSIIMLGRIQFGA